MFAEQEFNISIFVKGYKMIPVKNEVSIVLQIVLNTFYFRIKKFVI